MLWKISWWAIAIIAVAGVAFLTYRGLQIRGHY
jgi:hypothetical protein